MNPGKGLWSSFCFCFFFHYFCTTSLIFLETDPGVRHALGLLGRWSCQTLCASTFLHAVVGLSRTARAEEHHSQRE